MKKVLCTSIAFSLMISSLAGCASMEETHRQSAMGAGIGAAVGAGIGLLTAGGHSGRSAATGAAAGAALGGLVSYAWSRHMQEQKAAMEQATAGTGVTVTQTPDNQLKLEIPSDISFDSGRHDIKPNMRPVLDKFAVTLNQNPVTTVTIIGHTDSTGSEAINNPLSLRRAEAVRSYLGDRGVAWQRVNVAGRGEHEPIASNDTEEGKARNRRVEIFVAEASQQQTGSQAPAPGYPPAQGYPTPQYQQR